MKSQLNSNKEDQELNTAECLKPMDFFKSLVCSVLRFQTTFRVDAGVEIV